MHICITEKEAEALIKLKRMLREASTPVPAFLYWHAERHVVKHKENPDVDFVQALRERARQLREISDLLDIVDR